MVRRSRIPARALLFDDRHRNTWIVAYDPWYGVLESRALPAGADLVRAFLVELLRYHDAGWRLNDFSSSSASFHATKLHETKRRVCITVDDPTAGAAISKSVPVTPYSSASSRSSSVLASAGLTRW
jgi:hypothetical protein